MASAPRTLRVLHSPITKRSCCALRLSARRASKAGGPTFVSNARNSAGWTCWNVRFRMEARGRSHVQRMTGFRPPCRSMGACKCASKGHSRGEEIDRNLPQGAGLWQMWRFKNSLETRFDGHEGLRQKSDIFQVRSKAPPGGGRAFGRLFFGGTRPLETKSKVQT